VAPLLSPLFDFTPSTNSLGTLPVTAPVVTAPRPLSASSSYSSIGATPNYMAAIPSSLAPPPIMPGSALRLLNQGRAQGLFTPSTSGLSLLAHGRPSGFNSPGPYQQGGYSQSPHPQTSETPPPVNLKRHRSEADVDPLGPPAGEMLYILPRFFCLIYFLLLRFSSRRPDETTIGKFSSE
jgi:regulatory protein SWI6